MYRSVLALLFTAVLLLSGCAAGTCAVTSSPWLSTGFGCVLGSLLYTVLRPGRGKGQNGDGAE